jgi:hypothetical protein
VNELREGCLRRANVGGIGPAPRRRAEQRSDDNEVGEASGATSETPKVST